MKSYIPYLIAAVLLLVILIPTLHMRSMVQESLHVTHKMDQQLDSLWQIFHRYEATSGQYESVHQQLLTAQQRLSKMELVYQEQSRSQHAELLSIKQRLHGLGIHISPSSIVPAESIDSLLFRP